MREKNNSVNSNRQHKVFPFLAMLYMTIICTANLLIGKFTHCENIVVSTGTFIIPLWYILGDIIAEVYGYQIMRRLIWQSLICTCIFSFICYVLIKLPNPLGLQSHQSGFDYILGSLPRIFFGMLLAVIIGSFLNAYILTKWKVLIQGKFYWLRSLTSSAAGQLCFTCIALLFDLYGVVPTHVLIELIAVSYTIKIIITPIAVIPASFVAAYLKDLEGIDVYDTDTNFNPFLLQVAKEL